MYKIINHKPDDFIVSTNNTTTVRDFFKLCALNAGFEPEFEGEGMNEKCFDKNSNKIICEVNKNYSRNLDPCLLKGDYNKIKKIGWNPETDIKKISEKMVKFDLDILSGKIKNFGI